MSCPCPSTSMKLNWSFLLTNTQGSPGIGMADNPGGIAQFLCRSDRCPLDNGQHGTLGLTLPYGQVYDANTGFSVTLPSCSNDTWDVIHFSNYCYHSGFMGFGSYYDACIDSVVNVPGLRPDATTGRSTMSISYVSEIDTSTETGDGLLLGSTTAALQGYVDSSGVLNVVSATSYATGDSVRLNWYQADGTFVGQTGTIGSDGSWVPNS